MASSRTSSVLATVITTFPRNPLPTNYNPPADCSGIYNDDVFKIDHKASCLPTSFRPEATAFYSPGVQCPVGYTAPSVCTRSNVAAPGITTVTCCPVRGSITMSCVDDPDTLQGVFSTLFCTWIAGPETVILATTTNTAGNVQVTPVTMRNRDGINAFGIRMVYQSTDLTGTLLPTTSRTGTSSPLSTSQVATSQPPSAGLPTGTAVAIGIIVPVIIIAILVGAFFMWRRRKKAAPPPGSDGSTAVDGSEYKPSPYNQPIQTHNPGYTYPPSSTTSSPPPQSYYGPFVQTQPSEMATPVSYKTYGTPVELSAGNFPTELPTENNIRK
jgi:hypothetical protein